MSALGTHTSPNEGGGFTSIEAGPVSDGTGGITSSSPGGAGSVSAGTHGGCGVPPVTAGRSPPPPPGCLGTAAADGGGGSAGDGVERGAWAFGSKPGMPGTDAAVGTGGRGSDSAPERLLTGARLAEGVLNPCGGPGAAVVCGGSGRAGGTVDGAAMLPGSLRRVAMDERIRDMRAGLLPDDAEPYAPPAIAAFVGSCSVPTPPGAAGVAWDDAVVRVAGGGGMPPPLVAAAESCGVYRGGGGAASTPAEPLPLRARVSTLPFEPRPLPPGGRGAAGWSNLLRRCLLRPPLGLLRVAPLGSTTASTPAWNGATPSSGSGGAPGAAASASGAAATRAARSPAMEDGAYSGTRGGGPGSDAAGRPGGAAARPSSLGTLTREPTSILSPCRPASAVDGSPTGGSNCVASRPRDALAPLLGVYLTPPSAAAAVASGRG